MHSNPQNSETAPGDFDAFVSEVEANYAGWHDKVPGREKELEDLTSAMREKARVATRFEDVDWAMEIWIDFFRDRHLKVQAVQKGHDPQNPDLFKNLGPKITHPSEDTVVLHIPSFIGFFKD
ncbi:MAG: hypothetical protein ACYTHM_22030, partial [Planctomycetota bacterium]